MKNKRRKGIRNHAPRCPYCGSHSILRSADGIYLDNPNGTMLYVCKNYPRCDAYVRTMPGSSIPLGTLANRELRAMRTEIHRYFTRFSREGHMTKDDTYQWLQATLGSPMADAHVGNLAEYECRRVLIEAQRLMQTIEERNKRKEGGKAA